MDDVFISYANEDKVRVLALAKALEARGFSVWFDRDIPPGATFDDVIEKELNAARTNQDGGLLVTGSHMPPERIGLYGASLGAGTTMIAFGQEPRIAALSRRTSAGMAI